MPTYRIIPADLGRDRSQIIAIWRRNLSSVEKLEEKFDWHFLNNPFGQGRCWLIEADGHSVGTTALGMRPLKLGDTETRAGVACDLAVDSEHRLLQPALLLQKAVVQSLGPDQPVVYGLPNANAAAPIRRAGYQDVNLVHRYAKPLRYAPHLRRRGAPPVLASAAGRFLDAAVSAARLARRAAGDRVEIEPLDDFDERFDQLWEDCRGNYPAIVARTCRYLRWRYRDCPLRSYSTLGLFSRDRSRLLGYLIYYVDADRALCADLLAGSKEEAGKLIAAWLNESRRLGMTSASIHCSDDQLISCLSSAGFTRRSSAAPGARSRGSKQELPRILMAAATDAAASIIAKRWYFTPGDEPYN